MSDQTKQIEPYIPYYIHQFGRIRFKGVDFLVRILRHYVMATPPLNAIEDRDKNLRDILSSEDDMIVSTHF